MNKERWIKNRPEFERPREKLLKFGSKDLSNSELLAIFLRIGVKDKSAIQLAAEKGIKEVAEAIPALITAMHDDDWVVRKMSILALGVLKVEKVIPSIIDVLKNDSDDFRIIAGEEISIGNSEGKNVHLLAINNPDFIQGSGDSAEKWFSNKPSRSIKIIPEFQTINSESLFIAAHPAEHVPFLQFLTLRRGTWSERDFEDGKIRFLQIVNSSDTVSVLNSIEYWKKLLLKRHRFFILAGNDAHGNFGIMRQIKIPFVKLFYSKHQVFGKFFTVFHYEENEPIKAIKNGEIIISNGPFINFQLETEGKKYPIGSEINASEANIFFNVSTSPEFGDIVKINLYAGKKNTEEELTVTNGEKIDLSHYFYLRMSIKTAKNGFAFTNAIFIRKRRIDE